MDNIKRLSAILSLILMAVVIGIVPIVNRKKGEKLPDPYWMKKKISSEPGEQLVNSINAFGIDLYHELIKTQDNLIFSPYSLTMLLTMLLLGSRGATAFEVFKTLHYNDSGMTLEDINVHLHAMLKQQRIKSTEFDLNIANSLWLHKEFKIFFDFKSAVEQIFFSQENIVDFENEYTRDDINDWINKETNGKIPELFEYIDPGARLILANVVYFHGKWLHGFDEEKFINYDFHNNVSGGFRVWPVAMMDKKEDLKFYKSDELQAQIVQLPYAGEDVVMFVVLPFKKDGLRDLETQLTLESFYKAESMMRITRVVMKLPKFSLSSSLKLKNTAIGLGIRSAFQKGVADLSGISSTANLSVSQIIQKVHIDVNEKETITAAATGIELFPATFQSKEIAYVTCDHPFLFFVLHKPTRVFLFVGRVLHLERYHRTLEALKVIFNAQ